MLALHQIISRRFKTGVQRKETELSRQLIDIVSYFFFRKVYTFNGSVMMISSYCMGDVEEQVLEEPK